MDLSASTFWWVAAGAAVAAELATGTFYLLMIALGLAAGALASWFGLGASLQIISAALVGGGATAFWHWRRMSHPRSVPVRSNRDANLDIGERVNVGAWAGDRTARVVYRGSTWIAHLAPEASPLPGEHVVVAVEGNWLVLAPATTH
jgi:membrane protein implicated in regulation of membrane protease activity